MSQCLAQGIDHSSSARSAFQVANNKRSRSLSRLSHPIAASTLLIDGYQMNSAAYLHLSLSRKAGACSTVSARVFEMQSDHPGLPMVKRRVPVDHQVERFRFLSGTSRSLSYHIPDGELAARMMTEMFSCRARCRPS